MILQQARQQDRPIIFLHLGSLVNKQNILVVGEVKFSTSLLILVPDVVEFTTGSASCLRMEQED